MIGLHEIGRVISFEINTNHLERWVSHCDPNRRSGYAKPTRFYTTRQQEASVELNLFQAKAVALSFVEQVKWRRATWNVASYQPHDGFTVTMRLKRFM